MNESQKKKRNFRNSKKWKEFRHIKYVEQNGKCFLSGSKLNKLANLHHLDMSDENYENITNKDNFIFLNKSMHDCVHSLFRYYKKDEKVIDRLIYILQKMKELNH